MSDAGVSSPAVSSRFHGRRFPAAGFFRQRCILRRVIHSGRRFLRARVFQLVPEQRIPLCGYLRLDAPLHLPACHASGRRRGEKALVILSAPTDWEYDNYTTFTRDGVKVAEVLNLWPAASGASPFTDAMTEPYADNSFYPEGYGLLSTEDTELNGNALRILHMKTWPDDADKPWYPQYMFYELDGYVVELHFLTDEENGGSADIFRAVLGTMELHFSEKEAGGSSSSGGA